MIEPTLILIFALMVFTWPVWAGAVILCVVALYAVINRKKDEAPLS